MIELGQSWLAIEHANVSDTHIFAWNDDGFFLVGGGMYGLDDAVGYPLLLTFVEIDPDVIHRLDPEARRFFLPEIVDQEALDRLHLILLQAMGEIRSRTKEAVTLWSAGSRAYAFAMLCIEDDLVSPLGLGREVENGLQMILARLEEREWRLLFGKAFGEDVGHGRSLCLRTDGDLFVLCRENTAWLVTDAGLDLLGVFPLPNNSFGDKDNDLGYEPFAYVRKRMAR